MITIGIDIGLDGAIAAVDGETVLLWDMPTKPEGDGRRIDGLELLKILRAAVDPKRTALVAFERIRAGHQDRKGGAAFSQGGLMISSGIVKGVVDCVRWPAETVEPASWKRYFGLLMPKAKDSEKKAASLALARRLMPSATDRLRLVKHADRAEALLIGLYARDKFA